MDSTLAAAVAGTLGVLTGSAGVLAFRASEREQRRTPPPPVPVLPAGLADVLAVLSSSAVVVDPADRVVRASPAAYAFGVVRGDAIIADQLRELVRQVRRDGEIREAELEVTRGPLGGERVAVAARVAPLGGGLVLLLVEDRTEAQRLDAVRRDFVANVSHELKTPVGALILLAEAVCGASDDPEAVRRFAGRMQHEAERLSTLVQDVISLSRLQDHDALAEPTLVDLDGVLVDAVDRCRLAASAQDITLAVSGDPGVHVVGNQELLTTAVRNLVDNAVSYSPSGTRVVTAVRRAGDVVEVSVTDQGYGIPHRDLERIFERFYRVDPARSRATGGTGLGLSIVKHVIANHGGEMSVWSVEGAGSTFTIRLPVAAVPAVVDDDDLVGDSDPSVPAPRSFLPRPLPEAAP